jgi:hypothetical protein
MIHPLASGAQLPIGKQSQFTGQDTGQFAGIQGSVLVTTPPEYTSPIDPKLAAAMPVQDGSPNNLGAWW